MDYFYMLPDETASRSVTFSALQKEYFISEEPLVVPMEWSLSSKEAGYMALKSLFDYIHIVSDSVKEVLEAFGGAKYSPFILTSEARGKQLLYWKIQPEHQIILAPKAKNLQCAPIQNEWFEDEPAVLVLFQKTQCIALRFDVAECILKRNPLGIYFISPSNIVAC